MNGDAYMARMPTKITIRYEKSISILVRSGPPTSHKAPARRAGVVSPDGTPRWQGGVLTGLALTSTTPFLRGAILPKGVGEGLISGFAPIPHTLISN
jgi:hypothetical protein